MHTTVSAAVELGVSPRRIRQYIDDGRLPAERLGRDWLIQPADLARLRVRPGAGRPPQKKRKIGA